MMKIAIWGLPGYAFMGVNKEIKKMFGSSVLNYIIAARTAKGFEDAQTCTPEERAEIIYRWKEHKDEYQSTRMKVKEQGPEVTESGYLSPKGFMEARSLSFEERKKLHKRLHDDRVEKRRQEKIKDVTTTSKTPKNCPFCRRGHAHRHTPRDVQESATDPLTHSRNNSLDHTETNEEFEHAIHTSVAATSRGNHEEDEMIERAIRASVRELQKSQTETLTDEQLMERAIHASIEESHKHHPADEQDAEHEARLQQAIQESLQRYRERNSSAEDILSDDDEAVRLAIQMSKEDRAGTPAPEEIDEALIEAIEKSKIEHESKNEATSEEERELERVLNESFEEEQRRRKIREGKVGEGAGAGGGGIVMRDNSGAGDASSVPRTLLATELREAGEGKENFPLAPMNTKADAPAAVGGAPTANAAEVESKADEEALKLAIEQSLKG